MDNDVRLTRWKILNCILWTAFATAFQLSKQQDLFGIPIVGGVGERMVTEGANEVPLEVADV